MEAPAVSVIIPAYNASGCLRDALASVFAQTCTDFEVIVVNDGSPDSAALETSIDRWSARVRYFVQEHKGAAAARNVALAAARGDWIAFLDADDAWAPEYLERQLAELARRPELDLVYCDARLTGESPLAGRTFMETAPSDGPVTVKALVSFACNVITSGVLARRRTLLAVGGFDDTLQRGHDFNLWVRLAHYGAHLGYHRSVLLTRGLQPDSLSGDVIAQHERAVRALTRTMETVALQSEDRTVAEVSLARLIANLELERGKACLRQGEFQRAADHLALANRTVWNLKRAMVLGALRVSPALVRAGLSLARRGGLRSPPPDDSQHRYRTTGAAVGPWANAPRQPRRLGGLFRRMER